MSEVAEIYQELTLLASRKGIPPERIGNLPLERDPQLTKLLLLQLPDKGKPFTADFELITDLAKAVRLRAEIVYKLDAADSELLIRPLIDINSNSLIPLLDRRQGHDPGRYDDLKDDLLQLLLVDMLGHKQMFERVVLRIKTIGYAISEEITLKKSLEDLILNPNKNHINQESYTPRRYSITPGSVRILASEGFPEKILVARFPITHVSDSEFRAYIWVVVNPELPGGILEGVNPVLYACIVNAKILDPHRI